MAASGLTVYYHTWLPLGQHFIDHNWVAVLLLQSKVARTGGRAETTTSKQTQFKAGHGSLRSTTQASFASFAVSQARAEVLLAVLCTTLHGKGIEVAFIWTVRLQNNEPALHLMSAGARVLSAAAALLGSLSCRLADASAATPAVRDCSGI